MEVALEAQERVDVEAFAAFAAQYLSAEILDELVLSVEAKIESEALLGR